MKIFNSRHALKLIPQNICSNFSVVGSLNIDNAIDYTLKQLQNNKRIQNLILVSPRISNNELLKVQEINKFGCSIYFITRKKNTTQYLNQFGIHIIYNK